MERMPSLPGMERVPDESSECHLWAVVDVDVELVFCAVLLGLLDPSVELLAEEIELESDFDLFCLAVAVVSELAAAKVRSDFFPGSPKGSILPLDSTERLPPLPAVTVIPCGSSNVRRSPCSRKPV